MVLALFIWWCRTDEACCDVEKPLLYRCGCKKKKDEEHVIKSYQKRCIHDCNAVFFRARIATATLMT